MAPLVYTVEQDKATNQQDYDAKESYPKIDYKMECDRLRKENHTQDTIIKALVFYIQEAKR